MIRITITFKDGSRRNFSYNEHGQAVRYEGAFVIVSETHGSTAFPAADVAEVQETRTR